MLTTVSSENFTLAELPPRTTSLGYPVTGVALYDVRGLVGVVWGADGHWVPCYGNVLVVVGETFATQIDALRALAGVRQHSQYRVRHSDMHTFTEG